MSYMVRVESGPFCVRLPDTDGKIIEFQFISIISLSLGAYHSDGSQLLNKQDILDAIVACRRAHTIADNSWSLAWRAVPSSQEGTCVSALQPGGHLRFCEIGGHLEGTFVKLEDNWRALSQTLICKLQEKVDDREKYFSSPSFC